MRRPPMRRSLNGKNRLGRYTCGRSLAVRVFLDHRSPAAGRCTAFDSVLSTCKLLKLTPCRRIVWRQPRRLIRCAMLKDEPAALAERRPVIRPFGNGTVHRVACCRSAPRFRRATLDEQTFEAQLGDA